MNTSKLAKQIAFDNKLPRAYKYDLFLREFDNMVEVVGLVDDPTSDMRNYVGREMMFPKKWVTLDVMDAKANFRMPA
jgi:hypothetical protein